MPLFTPAAKKRLDRAMGLHAELVGEELSVPRWTYEVLSGSRPDLAHRVVLTGQRACTCTCEDFQKTANTVKWATRKGTLGKVKGLPLFQGRPVCKHVFAARGKLCRTQLNDYP